MIPSIRELHQRMLTSMSDDDLRTIVLYLSDERNDPTLRYENLGGSLNERILRLVASCREWRCLTALIATLDASLPFVLVLTPEMAIDWQQWALAEDERWKIAPISVTPHAALAPDRQAQLCRSIKSFRLLAGLLVITSIALLVLFTTRTYTPVNARTNPRFYASGIAPLFGDRNTIFTVNIAGFAAVEPLALWFTDPKGTPFYPSASPAYFADAAGNFVFQFIPTATFAPLTPGLWTFTAYGVRSGEMTITYFTISSSHLLPVSSYLVLL